MSINTRPIRIFKLILLLIMLPSHGLFSHSVYEKEDDHHEITIYFTKSAGYINWENPSKLLKSSKRCYLKAALRKNYYVIGHTQVRLTSSLIPAPLYAAVTGAVQSEKVELVLKKKVGLGALGSTIQGKMETEEDIKKGIALYAKRNMVSYIKFKINAEAVKRILDFMEYYCQKTNADFAPCEKYNGSLWPRYENEGSGCSAFALTLLDVANIIPPEANEWLLDVKLPMELIGGEFNNNKRIKLSTIRKTNSWYIGIGLKDIDYVNYKVFDPSIINSWICEKRIQNDSIYHAEEEDGLPGLLVDKRNVMYDTNDTLLRYRTDTTFFVKYYYNEIHGQKEEYKESGGAQMSGEM